MLDVIEKLLVLQDRDRRLRRVRTELAAIEPQRQAMKAKSAGAIAALEKAKQRGMQIETRRKQFDLDIEAKKALIEKYGHLGRLANNARKHQLGMSVPMATVNFLKDFIVKHDMCDDPIGRHIVGGNGRPVLSTASGPSKSAGDPNQCNFGRAG